MNLRGLGKFQHTRIGHLVFGLLELAVAFWLAQGALERGNVLLWGVVMLLLIAFVLNATYLVRGVKA